MKVINPRASLLSRYEVLEHFRELHNDNAALVAAVHNARMRTKAENDGDWEAMERLPLRTPKQVKADQEMVVRGVSEDLLFVTDQVVGHLQSQQAMTYRQTPEGVHKLSKALQRYGLIKGEILQVIDLVPTKLVELYVIIEECDDRLTGAQMQELLDLVASTLLEPAETEYAGDYTMDGAEMVGDVDYNMEEEMMADQYEGGEEYVTEAAWGGEGGVEDGEKDGAIDE